MTHDQTDVGISGKDCVRCCAKELRHRVGRRWERPPHGLHLLSITTFTCLLSLSYASGSSHRSCALQWPQSPGSTWSGGYLRSRTADERRQCAAPSCCFPTDASLRSIRDTSTLLATLEAIKKKTSDVPCMVILYHGNWCPFSAALLPIVRCLPEYFPADRVQFVSVLESDVGLRTLIQLGVDSFPTLKVVQASGSVSIPGPRVLKSLISAVSKITAVAPCHGPFPTPLANSSATCPPARLHPSPGSCVSSRNGCWSGSSKLPDHRVFKACSTAYLSTSEPLPVYDGVDMLAWVALLFILLRLCIYLRHRHWSQRAGELAGAEEQPQPEPDAPPPERPPFIYYHHISTDDDDDGWGVDPDSSSEEDSDESYDYDTETPSESSSPSSSEQHNTFNRFNLA